MEYERIISRVQEVAAITDREEAARGTVAVLATLGERLYRTEASHLAAQLPRELKPALFSIRRPDGHRTDIEPFSLDEFYHRVGARAGVRHPQAVRLARAVTLALKEAIAPGELRDVRAELPADYAELFV